MAKHKHRDSKPDDEMPQAAEDNFVADEQQPEGDEEPASANDEQADEAATTDEEPTKPARVSTLGGDHFYSEIARLVATLFVGVLALMTFMLTVGVQRPKGLFAPALYAAIVILPLNLLAFVFGHLFADMAKQAKFGPPKKLASARKRLRVMRFLQMLLFILAVLSAAFLAYAASQFFFNIPANPVGGGAPPQ